MGLQLNDNATAHKPGNCVSIEFCSCKTEAMFGNLPSASGLNRNSSKVKGRDVLQAAKVTVTSCAVKLLPEDTVEIMHQVAS